VSELFTAVKTVMFSILVLMVLQMRWQGETLEDHSEEWIYRSDAGAQLQTVAKGAVKAAHSGWEWVQDQIRNQDRDQGSRASRSQRTETRTDDLN
jgi:hypothetical protein